MFSETLYNRMKFDKEFNESMEKASHVEYEYFTKFMGGERPDPTPLNRSYYELHKSAFELSILFSPRAAKVPAHTGDYLLTILGIAKMGQCYISNLRRLINTSNLKGSSVKRIDKMHLSFNHMQSLFESMEMDVQSALDRYLSTGTPLSRADVSRYSKGLLRIRRAYFRMRSKVHYMEHHFNFSAGIYDKYEPLVRMMRSQYATGQKTAVFSQSVEYKEYAKSILQESNNYLNAVYDLDSKRARCKRRDYVDLENTAFIVNYTMPRDAVLKHVLLLRSLSPAAFFNNDELIRTQPAANRMKPDAIALATKKF